MLSRTNYYHKNFALRFALKRRQTLTRKWPITCSRFVATFTIGNFKFLDSVYISVFDTYNGISLVLVNIIQALKPADHHTVYVL